jgi:hypothetical protein
MQIRYVRTYIPQMYWYDRPRNKVACKGPLVTIYCCSIFMDSKCKPQLAVNLTNNYSELLKNFVADSHNHDVCASNVTVQLFTVPSLVRLWLKTLILEKTIPISSLCPLFLLSLSLSHTHTHTHTTEPCVSEESRFAGEDCDHTG